ncbi:hypothetical protein WJ04_09045 [Burkholderia vietnamiensis]|uniref:DUF2569 family protein n=1 Tax=Burkholderia vietnamiensis TaxID=60552 RepID=UPI00075571AA|nr:DUF2569 family protein [Burkholderia vietnamiensis]KVF08967.1 hypothetical protein WJ04_09045 [Burkholderia vietnamiensis]
MGTSLETAAAKDGPRGVGGWLQFFIVSAIFLGPLFSAGGTASSISQAEFSNPTLLSLEPWASYKTAAWILVAIRICLTIAAGFSLATRKVPSSVRFTKWVLWIAGPISTVIDSFVLLPLVLGISLTPNLAAQAVGSIISAIIVAGIWHAYFSRSKRVRNTYYPS